MQLAFQNETTNDRVKTNVITYTTWQPTGMSSSKRGRTKLSEYKLEKRRRLQEAVIRDQERKDDTFVMPEINESNKTFQISNGGCDEF